MLKEACSHCYFDKGYFVKEPTAVFVFGNVNSDVFNNNILNTFQNECHVGDIPDSNNLSPIQMDAIHLGNEDGCHSLV